MPGLTVTCTNQRNLQHKALPPGTLFKKRGKSDTCLWLSGSTRMVGQKQRRHGGVATPNRAVSGLHSTHSSHFIHMACNSQPSEITHGDTVTISGWWQKMVDNPFMVCLCFLICKNQDGLGSAPNTLQAWDSTWGGSEIPSTHRGFWKKYLLNTWDRKWQKGWMRCSTNSFAYTTALISASLDNRKNI